jgi:uncharacterized protein YbbK (DUF523 family)/uncharacterized protein YbgA (DUF1722 family)
MAPAAEHTRQWSRRVRIAASSCLIGQAVRYDGGDKRNVFVTEALGRHVDIVPICPEVGIGMGVPRAPIRLVGAVNAPRAVGVREPERDVTEALQRYAQQCRDRLDEVSGYVFKSRSPSCGVTTTPIAIRGRRPKHGSGIFAAAVRRAHPLLPVIEDHHLDDARRRDNFVERVFAYARWQCFRTEHPSLETFQRFHAAQRLAVLAHGQRQLAALDKAAQVLATNFCSAALDDYARVLLTALTHQVTRRRRQRVARKLAQWLAPRVSTSEARRIELQLEHYSEGQTLWPQIETVWARVGTTAEEAALQSQTLLDPCPAERALRTPPQQA